jgi:hypothetical protein
MHAIDPADHQQRAVLNIMVGVMMGDEDRTQCRERDPGAGVFSTAFVNLLNASLR